ncbi:MAG: DUF4837 family protein [Bacteroidales bacterium]|nr:DUF4837 family protein [Bacteroidales bacterium]
MKKIVVFLALSASLLLTLAGCGDKVLTGKPGSSGKTLELMIVATDGIYNGPTQMVLDSLFKTPQVALNQPEPRFDVVHIAPSSFRDNTMFQSHRNILILEVDPQGLNKVYMDVDKWSTPQVVIRMTATDRQSLDSMLLAKGERLLSEYYKQEYRRMSKVFSATPNTKVISKIKEKYGFSLSIPDEFALAKMKEESNFTWALKRTKDFDLFLYIFDLPAKGDADYEEATILDNIDTMLHRYVPGPREGSYPGVERRDFFYTRDVVLGEDIKAVEIRGLWRTYNDFMGGPFVSYTFTLPGSDKVYTMMGSVYSPSERNKMVRRRDLLMQIDGICRSIKIEN